MVASDPMLEVRGLTKRYGPVLALDHVSFEIRRGEIFGYIGPNGAGKTTTIKAIVGLLSRFDGEVVLEGRPIRASVDPAAPSLGYLPQKAAFQEWRTVDQALRTFGRLSGLPADEATARIGPVLARLGIEDTRSGASRTSPAARSRRSGWRKRSSTVRRCSSSTSRWPGSTP